MEEFLKTWNSHVPDRLFPLGSRHPERGKPRAALARLSPPKPARQPQLTAAVPTNYYSRFGREPRLDIVHPPPSLFSSRQIFPSCTVLRPLATADLFLCWPNNCVKAVHEAPSVLLMLDCATFQTNRWIRNGKPNGGFPQYSSVSPTKDGGTASICRLSVC